MQISTPDAPVFPKGLQIVSKLFSWVFHPLFIPTYLFFWLLNRFPFEFSDITEFQLFARKITVFWMTAFFPAFSVFLLWRLKFIDSIFLRTSRERIIPYIITMTFYWWMWYLSRNFTDQPVVLKMFFLGIFIATAIGLILNSFFKISMHGMAVGGMAAFVIFTCFFYHQYLGADIAIALLILGSVPTARLIVSSHNTFEIYSGLLVGILSQCIAFAVY